MESSGPVATRKKSLGCIATAALTGVAALIILGIVASKFLFVATDAVKGGMKVLSELPLKFQSQHITQTFRESITQITPTKGDVLELAVLESDETIAKFDMRTVFNDLLYLGTTVSEIKVPAVYRYHLKISDDWKLETHGNVVTVVAPIIRPSLPPAIRTERMEKKSENGWLMFNKDQNLAELEKSITPTLEKRAGSEGKIKQVREGCRKAVAEFVKTWLIKEDQWEKDKLAAIVVVFADEPAAKELDRLKAMPATAAYESGAPLH
jgi:hypothetical protein